MATLGEHVNRRDDSEAADSGKSTPTARRPTSRLPGIDIIRVSLTCGILLFHTTLAYSSTIPWNAFGSNHFSNTGVLYYLPDLFIYFMDVWQMPMFFFLSGVSAFYALKRRSAWEFRKERVHRLLVPWLVLVLNNGVYSILFFAPSLPKPTSTFSEVLMSMYIAPSAGQGWFLLHLFLYSQVDKTFTNCTLSLLNYFQNIDRNSYILRTNCQSIQGEMKWTPSQGVLILLKEFGGIIAKNTLCSVTIFTSYMKKNKCSFYRLLLVSSLGGIQRTPLSQPQPHQMQRKAAIKSLWALSNCALEERSNLPFYPYSVLFPLQASGEGTHIKTDLVWA